MKPLIAALALAVTAVAAPAFAAPAPAGTVDKAASKVAFSSSFDGDANLAGSSVTATFDMTSAASGEAERDKALPGADWFNAAAAPKATFTATSFKALGGGKYTAAGNLTIRGITKPLTLPFTLVITGDTAKMTSSVGINRLAFGVGQNEWKTTQVVPGTVTVNISLTARRAK